MQRKSLTAFIFAVLMCFSCLAAAASTVTDVNWGVDKENVLRVVVDLTEKTAYSINRNNDSLSLNIDGSLGKDVPRVFSLKSDVGQRIFVNRSGKDKVTVKVALKQTIGSSDYKSFFLKKDPVTKRPARVVLDITANRKKGAVIPGGSTSVTGEAAIIASMHAAREAQAEKDNKSKKVSASDLRKQALENAMKAKEESKKAARLAVAVLEKDKVKALKNKADDKKELAKKSLKDKDKDSKNTVKDESKNGKLMAPDEKGLNLKEDAENLKKDGKADKNLKGEIPQQVLYRADGGIKGKRITIDPGHGGSDPGAIGLKGLKEKEGTIEMARYLKERLEKRGAIVTLTRDGDYDVFGSRASTRQELQARVDISSVTKADIFISIHHNANDNRKVGGIGTYYYPKSKYDEKLARCVQAGMTKSVSLSDYGVRQANFYVIKRSLMPSVLVEVGFISNPDEEKLIKSRWFQKRIAKAICEGIEDYFS